MATADDPPPATAPSPEPSNNSPQATRSFPAGESMTDHQVHERAWLTVIDGEVEIAADNQPPVTGSTGLLVEFDPRERHAVHARTSARILLVLTPWPGRGHPGALTLQDKARARQDAAKRQTPVAADPPHAVIAGGGVPAVNLPRQARRPRLPTG